MGLPYHDPMEWSIQPASRIDDVSYEIRGTLAKRARELEELGHEILYLNIGNPGAFGFRTPETMRQAVIRNLQRAEPYGFQMGIFPAREAVAMQFQDRGLTQTRYHDVIIGNGVSELVDLSLRALLEPGDEVLIPAPDYPLWSASVVLNGGRPVYYPCPPEQQFEPDLEALGKAITSKTRALVVINPNNPTGAVYSKEMLEALVAFAKAHQLIILADEIYDGIAYDSTDVIPLATLVDEGVCLTFGGLSKVYRACGYRIGWAVLSGATNQARAYWEAIEKLAALRLCANMPGQWAIQTALGGHQSIAQLVAPGGRLHLARQAVVESIHASQHLSLIAPKGALYAFPAIKAIDQAQREKRPLPFTDQAFAETLLEEKHILVVPGSSFNFQNQAHFRLTLLPEPDQLRKAVGAMDEVLGQMLGP